MDIRSYPGLQGCLQRFYCCLPPERTMGLIGQAAYKRQRTLRGLPLGSASPASFVPTCKYSGWALNSVSRITLRSTPEGVPSRLWGAACAIIDSYRFQNSISRFLDPHILE